MEQYGTDKPDTRFEMKVHLLQNMILVSVNFSLHACAVCTEKHLQLLTNHTQQNPFQESDSFSGGQ